MITCSGAHILWEIDILWYLITIARSPDTAVYKVTWPGVYYAVSDEGNVVTRV